MWLHGANRALMRRMRAGQRELNLFHHDFGVCDRYAHGLEAAAKVTDRLLLLVNVGAGAHA